MPQGLDAPAKPGASGSDAEWERSERQRLFREGEGTLPAFPKPENLIEVRLFGASSQRWFIDAASLVAGEGGVRYTLVARSSTGAENISYEGIRCGARQYRLYALGQRDGTWKRVEGEWRDNEPMWSRVLRREFFCAGDVPIMTAEEGLDALRSGGQQMRRDAVNRRE